jgi:hypothetical protein
MMLRLLEKSIETVADSMAPHPAPRSPLKPELEMRDRKSPWSCSAWDTAGHGID